MGCKQKWPCEQSNRSLPGSFEPPRYDSVWAKEAWPLFSCFCHCQKHNGNLLRADIRNVSQRKAYYEYHLNVNNQICTLLSSHFLRSNLIFGSMFHTYPDTIKPCETELIFRELLPKKAVWSSECTVNFLARKKKFHKGSCKWSTRRGRGAETAWDNQST